VEAGVAAGGEVGVGGGEVRVEGGEVGVGLVGYGLAGSILHAPLIGAEPRLRLAAVASSRADRVHQDLPAVPVVATPAELLADPGVELVVIAAPNTTHFRLARQALEAGRHVVVDKPFVTASAEAEELTRLARRHDLVLSVFHNRRWDDDYRTVERLVTGGVLGRVATYAASYNRFLPTPARGWREQAGPGSGILYDLGSHLIDQALHLFGHPATVMADVRAQRQAATADDYVHLVLGYGALRVILHAGSLVRAPGPRFEVNGDRGSFAMYGIDGQEAALRHGRRPGDPGWGRGQDRFGTLTTDVGGLPVVARVEALPGSYEAYYAAVAAAILDRGPVPVPAEEAAATIGVIEAAQASSRDGRVVEFG
jgi:scyllo-inositol 2-dehydrogenase (NADP+)